MDFDNKKESDKIVEFFKTAEKRKELCHEIASLGMDQTKFSQQYNIERLLIAEVSVLEEILTELKSQAKVQNEILIEVKQRNKADKKVKQPTLEDFDSENDKIETWIDGV